MPGDFSAIHDHGSTEWGAVQCFGAAEHYIYNFTKGVLKTLEPAHYTPGTIRAVDRNLIHQMGNSGDKPFLSLHVYGCDGASGTITGNARIFDLLEGSIQYTDGGVFFCLPEHQINKRKQRIQADRETTLRHHYQMSDRIRRILKTQPNAELERKLTLLQEQIHQFVARTDSPILRSRGGRGGRRSAKVPSYVAVLRSLLLSHPEGVCSFWNGPATAGATTGLCRSLHCGQD